VAGAALIARAGALALAALAAGCVSFQYQRDQIERPLLEERVGELVVGQTDLDEVLQRLGAPLEVWEGSDGTPVLAYGGLHSAEWNVNVSLPLQQASAPLDWTDTAARTHGVVILFDRELRLSLVRAGLLRDLRELTERRPPAPPEDGA
jgi:hypothetical protein